MLIKVNHKPLIEVGRATRFCPNWPSKRCLAKTRRGTPCQKAALKGKTRCRLHGGLSTGPRTPVQGSRGEDQVHKWRATADNLRTQKGRVAAARAVTLASKLEENWLIIRLRTDGDPFSRFINGGSVAGGDEASGPLRGGSWSF